MTQHSRATGFDVLRDDATRRLAGTDVVIEATGVFTTSRRRATDFFGRSTRAIAAAATELQAHHVLLSIVNCTLPAVQGYGYFAGKTAQEQIARDVSPRLTIVRSTQWFEFARQNLERMRVGPLALVPGMTIAPIALGSVAATIADVATGVRTDSEVEVTGPERMTLWEMTRSLPAPGVVPIPLPIPGAMGRAFRDGALVPAAGTEVIGPRFTDWLDDQEGTGSAAR
ncbi:MULTISPECIES: SDR family oxidoreductase [unclassified Curtobacterium]|uniref:SDR family oxidoreductase n=1 Tax=unclassified Curtobacterium TaxID=257496 RepID=UPI0015E8E58C|nr:MULTISPECIES: SDR family oxidoreductase [unclassified Curtobacterium]WIB11837.1 SDR family oxidoreductase [Curtobacterium sp. MCPF17_052]